jgi:hypothetical protein
MLVQEIDINNVLVIFLLGWNKAYWISFGLFFISFSSYLMVIGGQEANI